MLEGQQHALYDCRLSRQSEQLQVNMLRSMQQVVCVQIAPCCCRSLAKFTCLDRHSSAVETLTKKHTLATQAVVGCCKLQLQGTGSRWMVTLIARLLWGLCAGNEDSGIMSCTGAACTDWTVVSVCSGQAADARCLQCCSDQTCTY